MKFPIEKQFKLTENFINEYKSRKPNFGFGGLGEFVFYRTYSRIKEDGTNEAWWETVRRVVEGIYSIQWQHIDDYGLGWNGNKAQRSAQEMFKRIFEFKMLGSGRSLWAMGSPVIMEKGLSESLFNCSFISTENIVDVGRTFSNMMDFLMLGVGVGLDVNGSYSEIMVREPYEKEHIYIIPDTREGWVKSVELAINSFFGNKKYSFDYSEIRAAGEPIRGFGGVASGAEPLKALHESIDNTLKALIGKNLTRTAIADIANNIGLCVVSGNVRRSAEIILGDMNEEFLDLKDYEKNPERASHGWASNNSVVCKIGDDYSGIVDRIKASGDPGIIWLENFREYGRTRDEERSGIDRRIAGVNPCFSYDSRILTTDGYVKIGSLDGKNNVRIVDGDGNIQLGKVFKNGYKPTIELNFSNSEKIRCTEDHVFMLTDGNQIEALKSKNLKIMPYISEPKNINEKFVLYGYLQGDGNLGRLKSDAHKGVGINIGKKDGDILSLISGIQHTQHKQKTVYYLQGNIKEELLSLGFSSSSLPERDFPSTFDNWNDEEKASFIRGCFSANGSVNNRGRITYKTTSKNFAEKMASVLNEEYGISPYITTNKAKKNTFSNGTYLLKESYDINISQYESKRIFYNKIGFHHNYKTELLRKTLIESAPYVRSIKNFGTEAVYDFSIPKLHWGVIEGKVAHNCSEIGLESHELCNLVELIPSNHSDLEDFLKTIKYAYLFAKTITLLKTNWEETNRVLLRNRRIGLGITGIAQFVEKNGLRGAKEWMEVGYNTIEQYDKVYSDWLAIPESIKKTTVKPSGTLSLLSGVTPGVHFPQANYYIRRVRVSSNSPFVKILKDAKYNVEKANEDPEGTVVVEFPVKLREEMRTIDDVSMWEQIRLAEFCQKNWSDNGVSVTVTFTKDEERDLLPAIEYAQFGMKAISFLPKIDGGAYKQMPYETINKETYEKMAKKIRPLDFSRMSGTEAIGEKYCETDVCEIRTEENAVKEFLL